MTLQGKEKARKRTEVLVGLRHQHQAEVSRAQALLKEQQRVRKTLREAMQSGPRTVPQLAEDTGLPACEVLWHVTAMKKYGLAEEAGMDEEDAYCLYRLSKEAQP